VIDRAVARLTLEVDQAIKNLRDQGWTDEQILQAVDAGTGSSSPKLPQPVWRAIAVIGGEPLARARLEATRA